MKYLLFIGVLMLHLIGFAQTKQPPLELSKNLEAFKSGVWINGDYTIYVDRSILAANFRLEVQNATKSKEYYGDKDSNLVNYFMGNIRLFHYHERLWIAKKLCTANFEIACKAADLYEKQYI
jgi:hypothetical protein